MNSNEPASTGRTSSPARPDGRTAYDATDPIRRVSVLSTGQVQIHPDHEAATWRPVPVWLLTSRRWTAPRPINAYGRRWHRITPEATGDPALAPFRSGHDLFGDGSLVLLPTPGHTSSTPSASAAQAFPPFRPQPEN